MERELAYVADRGKPESKAELRRALIAKILAMDSEQRRNQEIELARKFESLPGFEAALTVLLYATAFPEEIDTWPMLRRSLVLGKRLILPVVDRPSKSLKLVEVRDLDRELRRGHRGIPEPRLGVRNLVPSEVDWVLVPGLGFDESGHRLGRGAGHYDRLLPLLRSDVGRWALILDRQWIEEVPSESHDQALDGVADSRRLIFGSRRNSVTP